VLILCYRFSVCHDVSAMGSPVITIFVRHGFHDGKPCKYSGDEFSRRCNCPKHLRWTQNGKQYRRKAGTRSWITAEEVKRQLQDQLAGRTSDIVATDNARVISEAIDLFKSDKKVQGISAGTLSRYSCELSRLQNYCERQGVYTVQGITRELLTGYCSTWESYYPSSNTRSKVRERLRSFLRYCYEAKWLERIPQTPKIKVDEPPTMPLEDDEYARLLDALYVVNPKRWDGKQSTQGLSNMMAIRIHALLQLMRWSGLAIRDAVSLPKAGLVWEESRKTYRVTTSRQKTGTDVSVLLPPSVSAELKPLADRHEKYVLFPGDELDFEHMAKTYTSRYIRPAFEAANIPCDTHMVSHRLRDTFAVDLLNKGVSIEEVAAALGDTLKTVEKHYAKWVKSRQNRLDDSIAGTWAN
jgi:integrase/recombinase XerD